MANKDHSLDTPIITAALQEFLNKGFEKASLRTIAANANVTVGAIYTRYKTKDILFCSLVQPLIEKISKTFTALKEDYSSDDPIADPQQFIETMQTESNMILHLLFDDYQQALLLLCKSTGSSMEHFFDIIVEKKIEESVKFFENAGIESMDIDVLKLLINSQFHTYYQIIENGYDLETARKILNAAIIYHTGGWVTLFKQTF